MQTSPQTPRYPVLDTAPEFDHIVVGATVASLNLITQIAKNNPHDMILLIDAKSDFTDESMNQSRCMPFRVACKGDKNRNCVNERVTRWLADRCGHKAVPRVSYVYQACCSEEVPCWVIEGNEASVSSINNSQFASCADDVVYFERQRRYISLPSQSPVIDGIDRVKNMSHVDCCFGSPVTMINYKQGIVATRKQRYKFSQGVVYAASLTHLASTETVLPQIRMYPQVPESVMPWVERIYQSESITERTVFQFSEAFWLDKVGDLKSFFISGVTRAVEPIHVVTGPEGSCMLEIVADANSPRRPRLRHANGHNSTKRQIKHILNAFSTLFQVQFQFEDSNKRFATHGDEREVRLVGIVFLPQGSQDTRTTGALRHGLAPIFEENTQGDKLGYRACFFLGRTLGQGDTPQTGTIGVTPFDEELTKCAVAEEPFMIYATGLAQAQEKQAKLQEKNRNEQQIQEGMKIVFSC